MENSFEHAFPEIMEGMAEGAAVGAMGIATGILLIVLFLALGLFVISYVLNAVGMSRIASRRGIHHAWLAWVPVGCNWLLGSISDHYQYVTKQKVTTRRRTLLILSAIQFVVCTVFIVGIRLLVAANGPSEEMALRVLSVALLSIAYLAMFGLSVAIVVFCYIAYYDLFRSCKPNYDVLFLVLGIVFSAVLPFLVFACCGSDAGMPARKMPKPPVYSNPEEPITQSPAEEEIPVVEAEVVEDPEL